ncbi:MAG: SLOG family protein [Desulfobulbus sp.]
MRIIIAGSRTVSEMDVRMALQRCFWTGFVTAVVSGTATGADQYGEAWAEENQIDVCRFPAEWEKYGKRAGPMRNKVMSENAEGLIAVWDGQSRGTYSMIDLARKRGLRITILRTDTNTMEEYPPAGELAKIWEIAEERAAIKEHDGGMSRLQAEREAAAEVLHSQ